MVAITPLQLLVIQPTPFCNLDCTYCYLPERGNKATMSDDTLDAIGRAVVASDFFKSDTTLVWHAGEPCVLPPSWYSSALERIEKASQRTIERQALQTNATLLSDAWIEFIKDRNISIGVSLDGPAWINDEHRVTRSGTGTYARALQGIDKLRKAGIPFHIIAVVTAKALSQPEELARSLADTGAFSIGLNIEEVDGTNTTSTLFDRKTDGAFSEFLCRFLDTIEAMENPPKIREFDRFINALKCGAKQTRHMENNPGAIISVGRTGDLATFSPELLGTPSQRYDNFCFGNVKDISDVSDMFLNRAYLRALTDVQRGVSLCQKTCRYFGVCGGGSPSNKLGETGRFDSTETAFCRMSVQATFETLLQRAGALA